MNYFSIRAALSLSLFWITVPFSCHRDDLVEIVAPVKPAPPVKPRPTTGPFIYAVPNYPSDWTEFNKTKLYNKTIGAVSVQESEFLRLEVRKEYGAAIQIYDKVTRQPLINFYDLGRESGMSSYGGPRSFADDSPKWKGIGYNPLQAGDDGGNSAPILYHGFVDGWVYTKAQCLSWAHRDARKLPFFYEQWARVDGNKVHVKVRLTHNREDKTFYFPEEQEWPMMMINGAKKVHFYNGSQPFSYQPTTVTDGIEQVRPDGIYVAHMGTPFPISEPWQAVEVAPNRLIGLYCPDYYKASYLVGAIEGRDNWEGGNTHTYISNRPYAHLDSDNVWLKEYTYIVGTEQEIRDYVYTRPRKTRPDFRFRKSDGRNGWVVWDGGTDQKEPFTQDNWRVTYVGKVDNGPVNAVNTKLMSPYGSWKASDFNTIYIRMAYSGTQSQLRLVWLLNGQTPNGVDEKYPIQNSLRAPRGSRRSDQQSVPINVINDGQMHTYKVNFEGHPMWKDVVQHFEITYSGGTSYVAPGEMIEMNYFGVNNPDE